MSNQPKAPKGPQQHVCGPFIYKCTFCQTKTCQSCKLEHFLIHATTQVPDIRPVEKSTPSTSQGQPEIMKQLEKKLSANMNAQIASLLEKLHQEMTLRFQQLETQIKNLKEKQVNTLPQGTEMEMEKEKIKIQSQVAVIEHMSQIAKQMKEKNSLNTKPNDFELTGKKSERMSEDEESVIEVIDTSTKKKTQESGYPEFKTISNMNNVSESEFIIKKVKMQQESESNAQQKSLFEECNSEKTSPISGGEIGPFVTNDHSQNAIKMLPSTSITFIRKIQEEEKLSASENLAASYIEDFERDDNSDNYSSVQQTSNLIEIGEEGLEKEAILKQINQIYQSQRYSQAPHPHVEDEKAEEDCDDAKSQCSFDGNMSKHIIAQQPIENKSGDKKIHEVYNLKQSDIDSGLFYFGEKSQLLYVQPMRNKLSYDYSSMEVLKKFQNKNKLSFGMSNIQVYNGTKQITRTIMFSYNYPYSSFIEYDYKTNGINQQWNYLQKFQTFEKFAWALYNGNHLFLIGGKSCNTTNPNIYRENDSFKFEFNEEEINSLKLEQIDVPNLNKPRYNHSCLIFEDFLFVLFGQDETGEYHSTFECLDLKNEHAKFIEMDIYMPNGPIKNPVLFESPNNVYMFGGEVTMAYTSLYKLKFYIESGTLAIDLAPMMKFEGIGYIPKFSQILPNKQYLEKSNTWNVVDKKGNLYVFKQTTLPQTKNKAEQIDEAVQDVRMVAEGGVNIGSQQTQEISETSMVACKYRSCDTDMVMTESHEYTPKPQVLEDELCLSDSDSESSQNDTPTKEFEGGSQYKGYEELVKQKCKEMSARLKAEFSKKAQTENNKEKRQQYKTPATEYKRSYTECDSTDVTNGFYYYKAMRTKELISVKQTYRIGVRNNCVQLNCFQVIDAEWSRFSAIDKLRFNQKFVNMKNQTEATAIAQDARRSRRRYYV